MMRKPIWSFATASELFFPNYNFYPLIPGAGIYYTMNYAVHGNMERFAAQGMHTAAIAGDIAVGVLLVTTIVRLCYTWKENFPNNK